MKPEQIAKFTGQFNGSSRSIPWKVHRPNFLKELLSNHGTSVLRIPTQVLGDLLHDVAARAIEIDDPALNILMLRLTLYAQADPECKEDYDKNAIYSARVNRDIKLTREHLFKGKVK